MERAYVSRKYWSLMRTLEARNRFTIVAMGNDCLLSANLKDYRHLRSMLIQMSNDYNEALVWPN